MAVNNPTIAIEASTRSTVQTVVVTVTSARPPETRRFVQDGAVVEQTQEAEREGQMLMYMNSSTGETRLYVVANVDSVLTWVPVDTAVSYRDSRTGQPWDPLAPQYSYLAS
jgi:hypothetical protein